MYAEYYGLTEKPFAIEPDSRFLVLVEHHREALATMVYAIEEREGWALVIGGPGVGKTTLVMALLKELGESVVAGVVTNPRLEPLDFFNQVALELGLDGPFPSKGPFLASLSQLVSQCRRVGKQILLVVDEAQHLSGELMEELRLLGNLDNGSPRVLNIFLVGQSELVAAMRLGGAQALMQRLHRNYALKPLSPAETADYIQQRLALAGCKREIFTPQATLAVHQVTGGIPRLINSVCDGALILGFAKDQAQVGPELVLAVAREDASLRWAAGRGDDSPGLEPIPAPQALPTAPAPVSAPVAASAQAEMMERATATVEPPPETPPPAPLGESGPPPEPPAPAPDQAGSSLTDLLDSLEAGPAAPLGTPPAASFEPPKPPPGLAPPRRPLPAANPEEAKEPKPMARVRPAPPAKNAKGGMLKRLLILALVVALAVGGYFLIKKFWYRIGPMLRSEKPAAEVVIPEAPTAPREGRAAQGPLDWGPMLRILPQSNQGQGDNRG